MTLRTKTLYLSISIFLLAILLIFSSVRSKVYPYSVNQDYLYKFQQSRAKTTVLTLKNGVITLPKISHTSNTSFLKLSINSSVLGFIFQPHVNIHSGKLSFTQYLEHGAKGTRYINISTLPSKNKLNIKLIGNHVNISDQTVQLVSFNNKATPDLKILVLAPHPDDAEIAAYGLYSDATRPYVVTATAGDAGNYKYDELYNSENPYKIESNLIQHYLKKGELRTWDSITIPLLGGVPQENIVNLGFFDATLSSMYKDKGKPVKSVNANTLDINTFRHQNTSSLSSKLTGDSSWNALTHNLSYLLKEIKPNIIVAPYPALDTNEDHKYTSIALFEALKLSNITEGSLYLYSNHYTPSEYFPYGKKGGTISLHPNFNKNFYFDSVYSHPLTVNKQNDKFFALEAMHDLRPDTEWQNFKGALLALAKVVAKKTFGLDNSYYKRAIRSNELFFVVDIENIYDDTVYNKITGKIDEASVKQ